MRTSLIFLFLAFTSAAQAIPLIPCEILLARGPRRATQRDVRNSTRMMTAEERHQLLQNMNAPEGEERDELFKNAPVATNKPPATAFARVALHYILSRSDWSPLQKAVFWEEMAIEIDQLPGIGFGSRFYNVEEGSYLFVGPGGPAILFRKDGKILKSEQVITIHGKLLNYEKAEFKVLNP